MSVSERGLSAEETVRRVLPWVLLSRFRNVITSLPLNELKPGEHEVRNIEYYVSTSTPSVHVPSASSLLYIPVIKYTIDTKKDDKELLVKEVDGKIVGYFYDGTYRGYSLQHLEEDIRKRTGEPTTLKYEEYISKFDVEGVLRSYYRLEAGKLFAAHLANHAKKKDGLVFSNQGLMKKISMTIEERSVYTEVDVKTSLFLVSHGNKNYYAPGIIPGILKMIDEGDIKVVSGEAEDLLKATLSRISSVGERLSPVSGGILQSTNKAKFTYVVGELDETNENGRRRWLASDIIKGANVAFYANEKTGAVEMSITMYPFNPPAIIVLNYPPFNLAPISSLIKDNYWQVKRIADNASKRLSYNHLHGTIYVRELQPLADAEVSLNDVKAVLRDGYPRLERLNKLLDGFEKIGSLGDILSMSFGRVEKVDRLLVSFLGKEEKKPAKKETVEEEKEEITL